MKINPLLDNLSALTSSTFSLLSKDVSHSFTNLTTLLRLSKHSRPNLNHLDNSSLTFTFTTFLHIFSAFSLTDITNSSSLVEKRHLASFVKHFQSHFNLFLHWLHFWLLFRSFRSLSLTLTIHHLKNLYQ